MILYICLCLMFLSDRFKGTNQLLGVMALLSKLGRHWHLPKLKIKSKLSSTSSTRILWKMFLKSYVLLLFRHVSRFALNALESLLQVTATTGRGESGLKATWPVFVEDTFKDIVTKVTPEFEIQIERLRLKGFFWGGDSLSLRTCFNTMSIWKPLETIEILNQTRLTWLYDMTLDTYDLPVQLRQVVLRVGDRTGARHACLELLKQELPRSRAKPIQVDYRFPFYVFFLCSTYQKCDHKNSLIKFKNKKWRSKKVHPVEESVGWF